MENQLNNLYSNIANTVIEMIPEEWNNIILYGEVSEELRKFAFYYYPKSRKSQVYYTQIWDELGFDKDTFDRLWYQIIQYLQELQNTFITHDQEPWTNLTMRIDHSGKFTIEFHYDDFSDLSPNESLIMWKYMKANIIDQDEYSLKYLQNTINKFIQDGRLFNHLQVPPLHIK